MNLLEQITDAMRQFEDSSPRTKQARDGILGPSDIGFCRQKAVLVTRQVPPSDVVPRWAASVGTAIHNYIEQGFKKANPDWICGSIDDLTVTAELPSGAVISGHPDVVIPEHNAVIDIKTVDGFAWTRRNGPSTSHKYQRHLYAMGLMQQEILDPFKTVLVGNLYLDRSGKEKTPLLFIEELDESLTAEIDSWVTDVIYAVKNGEDSARDVTASVCEQICEFFTVCRGGLAVNDGQEIITDTHLLSAIDMYVQGRDMAKEGDQMKKEAQARLTGVNGITSTHQIRWVSVGSTNVDTHVRPGHDRLDVRKVRKTS